MVNAAKKFDGMKAYLLKEAVALVKDVKYSKFDESVDLAIKLGVDPRHAEENIRVTTSLPHGTGKSVKVLVLTEGPKEKEAEEAGTNIHTYKGQLIGLPAARPINFFFLSIIIKFGAAGDWERVNPPSPRTSCS